MDDAAAGGGRVGAQAGLQVHAAADVAGGQCSGAAGGDRVCFRRLDGTTTAVPMADLPLLGRSMGLSQLVASIEAGVAPESSGRANLGTVAIMEAAARSMATGRAEPVEQIPGGGTSGYD